MSQMGWEDVLHEGGLVGALAADEGEDAVVDHVVEEHRCHHGQKPAAGESVEILVADVQIVDHREELADVFGLSVPGGQLLNPLPEGVERTREVRAEDVVQGDQFNENTVVVHLPPERIDEAVVNKTKT